MNNKPRRWHPPPAIRFSLLLHAAGIVALFIQPASWPWIIGILLSNHLVLSSAVLWPTGQLLGPNLTRLPQAAVDRGEVVLTFDDGPDPEVTPRVLDVLDQYQVHASFFCVGVKAATKLTSQLERLTIPHRRRPQGSRRLLWRP